MKLYFFIISFLNLSAAFFVLNFELSMMFILPGHEDSVHITGKIVRTDSKGIGVQFDELLREV